MNKRYLLSLLIIASILLVQSVEGSCRSCIRSCRRLFKASTEKCQRLYCSSECRRSFAEFLQAEQKRQQQGEDVTLVEQQNKIEQVTETDIANYKEQKETEACWDQCTEKCEGTNDMTMQTCLKSCPCKCYRRCLTICDRMKGIIGRKDCFESCGCP